MRAQISTLSRTACIAALLLLLSACNAVKLSYNNAQELTYWWLDGYLNFTAAQKPLVRSELATLHEWHRFNEIPAYIALLDDIRSKTQDDMTGDQVCQVAEKVRMRFRVLNLQLEPMLENIAPTLSREQLAHMEKRLERNNRKWRAEWLEGSHEAREAHRLKLAIKRAEMFYGRLNEEQREVLRYNIRHSVFDPQTSYAEKLRRQQDALDTLGKIVDGHPHQADVKLAIVAYFQRLENGNDDAYRNYANHMTADACQGFARLHNATSSAQRKHAADRLAGYIRDLEALKSSAQIR
jgi:hypothetical protein